MKLSQLLRKENNNIDVFRLLAAVGVIVGHAYVVSPQPPLRDGIYELLSFDYSGSLAVKFFFFLSGILVTNSIIERPKLVSFLLARCFRLFPGLVVCVLFTVFVIGGFFSTLNAVEYLSHPAIFSYIKANIFLELQWVLPGVFEKNPTTTVNGSLWTLPVEFFCYLLLAAIGSVGLLSSRIIGSVVLLASAAFLLWNNLAVQWFGLPPEAWTLPLFFSFGALAAANKDVISVDAKTVIGLALLAFLMHKTPIYPTLMCLFLFVLALYVSSLSWIRKFHLPGDFSYGVYLYGFPAQQVAKLLWPERGVHFNQFVGIVIALILGAISWYLVERPAMRWGRSLQKFPGFARV